MIIFVYFYVLVRSLNQAGEHKFDSLAPEMIKSFRKENPVVFLINNWFIDLPAYHII